jgi:hypothetical protein
MSVCVSVYVRGQCGREGGVMYAMSDAGVGVVRESVGT